MDHGRDNSWFYLLYMGHNAKDQKEKSKLLKWCKISFGGYALLLISLVTWGIFVLISTLLGTPISLGQ
jgi:hypothetical protein